MRLGAVARAGAVVAAAAMAHAGGALAAAPTIDSFQVDGSGGTFAECGSVEVEHNDTFPQATGSGPFSASHTFAPADSTAGCAAGSGSDHTSGDMSSSGAIDSNGVLRLAHTSQGSTTTTTSYTGDLNNDCLDVGLSINTETIVDFTLTDPTPYVFAGGLSSSGQQSDGRGTVTYSLVKGGTTIFDQSQGTSPNLKGTLQPGSYEYRVHGSASNDLACEKSGTETDSFSYDLRLVVGTVPPPVNTAPPVISGTPAVGQTLTCSNGSWDNVPTSFAYQWSSDGIPITGATGQTYLVQPGDPGHTLTCTVTATNDGGNASATSAGMVIPQPAAGVPANTTPPAISGTPHVGATLTCSQGVWTNNPTAFGFHWSRDGTQIPGAGSNTYVVQAPDQGHGLTCAVTASNPSGAGTPSTSSPVAVPAPTSASPAKCTLSSSGKVARHRGSKGTLAMTLTCDQGAAVRLAPVLSDAPPAHHGHRPKSRRFQLGAIGTTVRAGQADGLTLGIPAGALKDLVRGARESISIALSASNANGTSRTTIRISPLRL